MTPTFDTLTPPICIWCHDHLISLGKSCLCKSKSLHGEPQYSITAESNTDFGIECECNEQLSSCGQDVMFVSFRNL